MKSTLVAALTCLCLTNFAHAADPNCEAQATEKKLSGAAKDSFIKKCHKDAAAAAKTSCANQAAEQKLAGAAKDSFMKKCSAAAPK